MRTREGGFVEASVTAVLSDSVKVQRGEESRSYSLRSIDTLWVRGNASGPQAGRGALIGALALGVAFATSCSADADEGQMFEFCPDDIAIVGAVGAGLGALGGALVGAMVGLAGERWHVRFVGPL